MPEKRVKLPSPIVPGGSTEGYEVAVKESTERWTEITLEDGTVMRLKPTVISAIRIDNMYDAEGNPVYALKSAQTVVITSVPDVLKKENQPQGKVQ